MFQFINTSLHTLRHLDCHVNLCYEHDTTKELILDSYNFHALFFEVFTKNKYSFFKMLI